MLMYDEGYVVPKFHSAIHTKATKGQLLDCFVLELEHTSPKAIVEAFNRAATLSPRFENQSQSTSLVGKRETFRIRR